MLPTSEEEQTESEDEFEDAEEELELEAKPSKNKKLGKALQDSDSEVSAAEEDDEDAHGWGTSRKDYYNADVIETEADALEEEAEARRLQQKQLQGMTEADFGFDQADWLENELDGEDQGAATGGNIKTEVLPRLEITDAMEPTEKMDILRMRYPEFEPLAKEFVELQEPHKGFEAKAAERTKLNGGSKNSGDHSMPVVMKSRALRAYLSALSLYFAIFTSTAESNYKATAIPPEQLRDHGIMDTLLRCRDLWDRVKDLDEREVLPDANGVNPQAEHLSNGASLTQMHSAINGDPQERIAKSKTRKSKAQRALEAAQASASAARLARIQETEASLADLSDLTAQNRAAPKRTVQSSHKDEADDSSDIGDATSLTPAEAAEKAARNKKTLRFYTSQIAQKSNKRGAAGRDAGGDADLPYRERLRDKQARLQAEAEKRGQKGGRSKGEDLGGESDEDDRATVPALKGATADDEDYYDLVSSAAAKRKADKAALAALHAQAAAEGGVVRIVEEEGEGGKRAISYAIEKNKGLAPKRKKDVRNPRVKKRKKFEEKKKKLGSVRPVYKGGEGRGGYKGELTGIKKGLVRGTRL